MICQICKKDFEEEHIEVHHIHPRFMDNKYGDGMKLNLCKECHNKLHLILPALFFDVLTEEQKEEAIRRVVGYTKRKGGLNDS